MKGGDLEIVNDGACTGPVIAAVVQEEEEDCPEGKCPDKYDPVCGTGIRM